jgi:hypothetical protein
MQDLKLKLLEETLQNIGSGNDLLDKTQKTQATKKNRQI